MYTFNESDWKLFRQRIAVWQENHMERLCREYIELLSGDRKASEKWWDLEKRVKEDKRSRGVIADMARSRMPQHIAALLIEGVITEDDLDGFSDELRAWAAAAARVPGGFDRI